MIVEGKCNSCLRWFDAHWHQYPDLTMLEAAMNPYCPYCKATDVVTYTDESDDLREDCFEFEEED
jgi:hypothetical protein